MHRHTHEDKGLTVDTTLAVYQRFKAQLRQKDSAYAAQRHRKTYRKQFAYDWHKPVVTHPSLFDPNSYDSAQLVNAGVTPYVARNIVRYRAKGGKFRKVEDLAKIYGMDSAMFVSLKPYIIIEEPDTAPVYKEFIPKYKRVEKYAEGTVIDINKADTTELMKIPGIGKGYSAMIIAYRNKLGGFVSTNQLNEIDNLPAGFDKWFKIDPTFTPRKININRASIERLRSHPYMNFYKARTIIEYRKKYGKLRSIEQLRMLEEFNDGTLDKIKPYIEY